MERAINKRIKCIIEHLSISDREFAKQISLPQTTISNIFNRDSDVKYSVLEAILTQYGFISAEWLMRGKGEMILTGSTNPEDSEKEIFRLRTENKLLREMIGLKNEEPKEKIKSA